MCDPESSDDEKAIAMNAAIRNHGQITKDALLGAGIDRHLFGLKKMAEIQVENNERMDLPSIFETEAHAVWEKIIISTSTLASPALEGGGFGPVNEDCYALGYGLQSGGAGFICSTYRDDAKQMALYLRESLLEMVALQQRTAGEQ